jgi:hypothetical protein
MEPFALLKRLFSMRNSTLDFQPSSLLHRSGDTIGAETIKMLLLAADSGATRGLGSIKEIGIHATTPPDSGTSSSSGNETKMSVRHSELVAPKLSFSKSIVQF